MAEKARNLNPLVALLILILVITVAMVGGLIVLGFILHLLVKIADLGWSVLG